MGGHGRSRRSAPAAAMEDARRMLDSLMGPARDAAAKDQKDDGWKEKNVCKRYIVGFCPNDAKDNWFHNTRRDIGVCNKIHSDRLKQDFEVHADRERYEPDYQKEFLSFLEGLVREADAWIARERGNCQPPGKRTKIPEKTRDRMVEMQDQSEALLKKAEELAENGDMLGSKQAVATSTNLKEEIKEIKEKHTFMSVGESVCDVCGVRCNPDEQADYQAHLDGKLHESYSKIRKAVKEFRELVKENEKKAEIQRAEKSDRKEKEKDRDRDGKEKEKESGGKEKEKESGGGKDSGKERNRRDGDRDRDRRDRDRRDRSRSRDRRRR